jgi:hypothetical protein
MGLRDLSRGFVRAVAITKSVRINFSKQASCAQPEETKLRRRALCYLAVIFIDLLIHETIFDHDSKVARPQGQLLISPLLGMWPGAIHVNYLNSFLKKTHPPGQSDTTIPGRFKRLSKATRLV